VFEICTRKWWGMEFKDLCRSSKVGLLFVFIESYFFTPIIRGGNVDCLRYVRETGGMWDEKTTIAAAQNGNLKCLEYAFRHGCVWNVHTSSAAARFSPYPFPSLPPYTL
jgi:hypothetical protein